MIIRLPGGKSIAVDAKVPFNAYLEAAGEDHADDKCDARDRGSAHHHCPPPSWPGLGGGRPGLELLKRRGGRGLRDRGLAGIPA